MKTAPVSSDNQNFFPFGKGNTAGSWQLSIEDGILNIGFMSGGMRNGKPHFGEMGMVYEVEDAQLLTSLETRKATIAIEGIIKDDTAAGRDQYIHHVRMPIEIGLQLYLEGTITADMVRSTILVNDDEDDDREKIDGLFFIIPNVPFSTAGGTRHFDVLLFAYDPADPCVQQPIATMDKYGNVV